MDINVLIDHDLSSINLHGFSVLKLKDFSFVFFSLLTKQRTILII